jgi:hypothetical protein
MPLASPVQITAPKAGSLPVGAVSLMLTWNVAFCPTLLKCSLLGENRKCNLDVARRHPGSLANRRGSDVCYRPAVRIVERKREKQEQEWIG